MQRKFEKYGDVALSRIVRNPVNGESRGFGFVDMKDDEGADEVQSVFASHSLYIQDFDPYAYRSIGCTRLLKKFNQSAYFSFLQPATRFIPAINCSCFDADSLCLNLSHSSASASRTRFFEMTFCCE